MPADSQSSSASPHVTQPVRFSRVRRLPNLVTAGATLTVGLGVYALLGQFNQVSPNESAGAYLLVLILAFPLILTYAERAASIPGRGGAFNLASSSGKVWLAYATGWLTLGGYVCLIALLGWGVAVHVDLLCQYVLRQPLRLQPLAVVVIGAVALNAVFGARQARRSTGLITTAGLVFLLYVALKALFIASPNPNATRLFLESPHEIIPLATAMMASLWGLNFILSVRDEIHSPSRTIFWAMLLIAAIGSVLGILAAISLTHFPNVARVSSTPLLSVVIQPGGLPSSLTTIVYGLFGAAILFLGLNYVTIDGLRLLSAMTHEGFFPAAMQRITGTYHAAIVPVSILALSGFLLVCFLSPTTLTALAAFAFLWTTALVHIFDLLSVRPKLPDWRSFRLPFHPLLPGLVVAICVLLPLSLPLSVWRHGFAWLLLGVVYYVFYARHGRMLEHRRETIVGHAPPEVPPEAAGYHVMVGIANPKNAIHLIQTGARLAKAQQGTLLVLHVFSLPEQVPMQSKREIAEDQLDYLENLVRDIDVESVPVRPLVRLAPSASAGILETIAEEKVDLLVLGWTQRSEGERAKAAAILEPIVSRAPCDVVVLKGTLPAKVRCAVVPVSGGPNAPIALQLAQTLVRPANGEVVALNLVTGHLTSARKAEAQSDLEESLRALNDISGIQTNIKEVQTLKSGILEACETCDVLLMGVSREGLFASNTLDGLPSQIVSGAETPVMLVRRRETIRHYWVRRAWEAFTEPLPSLTASQRDEVAQQLRQAAQPTADFFILITLSSTIATYGLIGDSTAVIIGAMLVAPLMSPILTVGLSLVHGNLQLMRAAAETTIKGIVLAIIVGIAMTLISPYKDATPEIMARTGPDLLDLVVALASGAAAGYAISRKEVAAALPGVAIAVSLVPPLCVIGYGLGTSQLNIVAGSVLLFTTNLTAIVFAAAMTFLALGFYPKLARRQAKLVRTRGLTVAIISLVLISAVLCVFTTTTIRRGNHQRGIESIVRTGIADKALIEDLSVKQVGAEYQVSLTVVDLGMNTLTPEAIADMEQRLIDTVGGPVTIEVVTVMGSKSRLAPD